MTKENPMKTDRFVEADEHLRQALCHPCPTCGYKYETAWLTETIPANVVEEITTTCNELSGEAVKP
jgi:hypothetical protein